MILDYPQPHFSVLKEWKSRIVKEGDAIYGAKHGGSLFYAAHSLPRARCRTLRHCQVRVLLEKPERSVVMF